MALPDALWYIRYSGTLNSTAEFFAHGMHVNADGATPQASMAIAATDWLSDLLLSGVTGVSGVTDIGHAFSTEVHWSQVYVALRNITTGALVTPGLVTTISLTGGNGVSGYSTLPYQCAHCITTVAGSPGVRTHRNRYYLPPYSTEVIANRAQARVPTGLMSALGPGIDNGNTAAAGVVPSWQLAVYSKHVGDASVATELYIGDVIDTQRRRRRSLGEARTVHAL